MFRMVVNKLKFIRVLACYRVKMNFLFHHLKNGGGFKIQSNSIQCDLKLCVIFMDFPGISSQNIVVKYFKMLVKNSYQFEYCTFRFL